MSEDQPSCLNVLDSLSRPITCRMQNKLTRVRLTALQNSNIGDVFSKFWYFSVHVAYPKFWIAVVCESNLRKSVCRPIRYEHINFFGWECISPTFCTSCSTQNRVVRKTNPWMFRHDIVWQHVNTCMRCFVKKKLFSFFHNSLKWWSIYTKFLRFVAEEILIQNILWKCGCWLNILC